MVNMSLVKKRYDNPERNITERPRTEDVKRVAPYYISTVYIYQTIYITMMATSVKNKSVVEADTKAVGTKLTLREIREIQGLIEANMYISISDFAREAVRDKLRAIKVVKMRDVGYEEAKNEVLGYYRSYKEAYPHEVAEDLELDYDLVWKITEELKEEKRIEVVE